MPRSRGRCELSRWRRSLGQRRPEQFVEQVAPRRLPPGCRWFWPLSHPCSIKERMNNLSKINQFDFLPSLMDYLYLVRSGSVWSGNKLHTTLRQSCRHVGLEDNRNELVIWLKAFFMFCKVQRPPQQPSFRLKWTLASYIVQATRSKFLVVGDRRL